jgi:hypothetical protein
MKANNYRISPRLAWRIIDDKVYVFDPSSSNLHELSDSATHIWLALDKKQNLQKIAHSLADNFEVTEPQALLDTQCLITSLKEKGLLE